MRRNQQPLQKQQDGDHGPGRFAVNAVPTQVKMAVKGGQKQNCEQQIERKSGGSELQPPGRECHQPPWRARPP